MGINFTLRRETTKIRLAVIGKWSTFQWRRPCNHARLANTGCLTEDKALITEIISPYREKKKTTSLITTLKGRRADLSSHNGEITGRTSTRPPSLQAAGTPLSPLPFLGHCKYNSLRFLGSLHCYQHRGLWAGKPSHLLDILLCTYTHTFLDQETYIQQRGSMEKKCRDPELKMKRQEV